MASLALPEASLDAVTAFYSLIHVPRAELPALVRRIARWLRPGGLLLATFSSGDDPGWTGEWLGRPMFFSGYDAPTNRVLLADANFEIVIDEEVVIVEPEGPARFLWVLARRMFTPA
jgi:SAM-dependent methyltransferase